MISWQSTGDSPPTPKKPEHPLIDLSDFDETTTPSSPNSITRSSSASLLDVPNKKPSHLVDEKSPRSSLDSNRAPSSPLRSGVTKHEVQKSDTLFGIAIKYNVNVDELKKANKIFGKSNNIPHKYLIIPASQQ
jgi:LysM repeat protein